MTGQPAARFGDSVAHTESGFGFGLGGVLGLAAGALLVGATIATGGAALAVVAAVGGAIALTGGGALEGMSIGATYGHTVGDIVTGSPNVGVNSRQAARTLADVAVCDEHDHPQEIATGSTTVFINSQPAARLGDHTVCDARISTASANVYIGGGTAAYEPITAEVSPLAVTVARDMAIGGTAIALGAGAGAAFLAGGWAGVGVFGLQAGGGIAGGVGGALLGGKIGGAIDSVHGAAWGQAIGGLGGGAAGGVGGDALAGTTGLKGAAAFNYYSNAAQNIDVSTAPDTAVFYSGPGNRDLATQYANANGASTIEMTPGGSWLDNQKLFGPDSQLSPDQADQVWRTASSRYAQGASGDVTAFTEGAKPTGVFNTVEYPALMDNPNVTSINFKGK